jgi:hypothetical protein
MKKIGQPLGVFEDRATAHFGLEWAIAEGYPYAECRESGDGTVEVWSGPARLDDWQGEATPPEQLAQAQPLQLKLSDDDVARIAAAVRKAAG